MKRINNKSWILGAGLVAVSSVQGAGYEKVVTWSGKYSAIGGASSSTAQGSDALYFNPAGLGGSEGWDVNVNFSPTRVKFSGPIVRDSEVKEGVWRTLPISAVTASYAIDPKLTAGVGFYTAGGAVAQYDSIDPIVTSSGSFSFMTPQTVKTDLKIMELSVGAGYKLDEHWSFGAAWRAAFVNAAFNTYALTSTVIKYIDLHDLTATKWNGFRLGAQYRASANKWGVGAILRSSLGFTANGKVSGRVATAVPAQGGTITEADATVSNTFPLQVGVGGDYALTEQWRLFTEYTWTQYSKNQQIDLTGTAAVPALASTTDLATTPLPQQWRDQHNIRLAAEYTGFENLPVRFAYVITSQVIPKSTARAIFPAPGLGHTFVAGVGHKVGAFDLNAALEYSMESATVAGGDGLAGDYTVKAYALHLGAGYKF